MKTVSIWLVVAISALVGGCSQQTDVNAVTTPTATVVTPSPTSQPSAVLEDGRHFGYVKSINTSNHTLVFDLAEFLTGEDANRAARDDGQIAPGETVDNDYYIRNRNPKLRTLTVAGDVSVRIVNWPNCCESVDGELDRLAGAFAGQPDDLYHGPSSPYWLTVKGGSITLIDEQYLP